MDVLTNVAPDVSALSMRQTMYSFFAELFSKEVDEVLLSRVRAFVRIAQDSLGDTFARMADGIDEATPQSEILDELATDFASVFLAANNLGQAAFPYESVYTSEGGLLQQESTATVEQIYARHGFVQHMRYKVPADHVSLEFSYMAWLCEAIGKALDACDDEAVRRLAKEQNDFFAQHIQTWIFRFIELGKTYAKTGFYQDIFSACETFMHAESTRGDSVS